MDRSFLIAFAGCVAATYASRVAGFYAGTHDLAERNRRILGYVPIGAFTAIVALGLADSTGELDARLPAVLVAGSLAYRRAPLWVCLAIGLAAYYGLRQIVG
jgi:branched-subunit amino acid transport protein